MFVARFTYPAAAGTTLDPAQVLTWTTVANVQANYLYVGSTPGAKNLVNTGAIQQTSYVLPSATPRSQLLYARLSTKVAGFWRYTTFDHFPRYVFEKLLALKAADRDAIREAQLNQREAKYRQAEVPLIEALERSVFRRQRSGISLTTGEPYPAAVPVLFRLYRFEC